MITVYDANIALEDLRQIELKTPAKAGKNWMGIQHGYLADSIIDEARTRNWEVLDSKFSLSKDEADIVGAFNLTIPSIEAPEGQTLALGFVSSNNWKKALTLSVGTEVAVCHNGMVTGEIVLHKKHTIGLDLQEELESALDKYMIKAQEIGSMIDALRQRDLKPEEAEHALIEAGRRQLMPWSRLGKVDHEYRQPTFAEHGVGTSWALLNAFTYVAQQNPVHRQMDQMNRFRQILPVATAA